MIAAENLTYRVQAKTILHRLNFTIEKGSFTVVVGENGAGKTTLLKLLMGFARPSSGYIRVLGHEPHLDPYRDRFDVAYLAERLSPPVDWSVEEFLAFNRAFYPRYSPEKEKDLLKVFRLNIQARIGQLSTGESRRVQVVASLAALPKIILVDEITAVLDIVGRSKFMGVLKEQLANGATILMATNIIDDVDSYASHVLLLHNGHRKAHAPKKELQGTGTLTERIAALIEEPE